MVDIDDYENKYSVSIVVCTYRSDWDKLEMTLDSILIQDRIDYEIVITDDGSEENLFNRVIAFFESRKFYHYKLVSSETNKGTVLNFYNGVMNSSGKYIKGLAPGDMFCSSNNLARWVRFINKRHAVVSFCDAICYYPDDNDINIIENRACPQAIEMYRKGGGFLRRAYLLYDDIALGVAILSDRKKTIEYLRLILNKVKYAEDNIYRLMIYQKEKAVWFEENVVLYEIGTGISTSENKDWKNKLEMDWVATNRILIGWMKDTRFDKLLSTIIQMRNGGSTNKLTVANISGYADFKEKYGNCNVRVVKSENYISQVSDVIKNIHPKYTIHYWRRILFEHVKDELMMAVKKSRMGGRIALYPFGKRGKAIKKILNDELGVEEAYHIDNFTCDSSDTRLIKSTDIIDDGNLIIIITTDVPALLFEIYKIAKEIVSKDRIYIAFYKLLNNNKLQ